MVNIQQDVCGLRTLLHHLQLQIKMLSNELQEWTEQSTKILQKTVYILKSAQYKVNDNNKNQMLV